MDRKTYGKKKKDVVQLFYDNTLVVNNGVDAGKSEEELAKIMEKKEFIIKLDIGVNNGEFTMWSSDISYEYIKINADYHT